MVGSPDAIGGAVGLWLIGYAIFIMADTLGFAGESYIRESPFMAAVMLVIYVFWPILVLLALIRRRFN